MRVWCWKSKPFYVKCNVKVSFCSQVSNGDLAEAVAFLTEKNAKVPQQDEATYYQTAQIGNDRYISVGSQADTSTYLRTVILRPGRVRGRWWLVRFLAVLRCMY